MSDRVLGTDLSVAETTAGPKEAPQTTAAVGIGAQTRALGHRLDRLAVDRARDSVDSEDRATVRAWAAEARQHAADPLAFDIEFLADDRPLD